MYRAKLVPATELPCKWVVACECTGGVGARGEMQRQSEAPSGRGGGASMSCLDDACLLNIFRFLTPLPDLFAAAAVCKVRRPDTRKHM